MKVVGSIIAFTLMLLAAWSGASALDDHSPWDPLGEFTPMGVEQTPGFVKPTNQKCYRELPLDVEVKIVWRAVDPAGFAFVDAEFPFTETDHGQFEIVDGEYCETTSFANPIPQEVSAFDQAFPGTVWVIEAPHTPIDGTRIGVTRMSTTERFIIETETGP